MEALRQRETEGGVGAGDGDGGGGVWAATEAAVEGCWWCGSSRKRDKEGEAEREQSGGLWWLRLSRVAADGVDGAWLCGDGAGGVLRW